MSIGIIRDELDKVVGRLRNGDIDDDSFAISLYKDASSTVEINEAFVRLIEGENSYPRDAFTVNFSLMEQDRIGFDGVPPGILPYLVGAKQLKGSNPSPFEVGIPLFSNESRIGIRWLLKSSNEKDNDFTPWIRLTEDKVMKLSKHKVPNKSKIISTREGASVMGAHPEDRETVLSRVEDYWWEVWCARSQELMNSWRILIPNTSINLCPVILSPINIIVSDNFNVILCTNSNTAIAGALVLGLERNQDFLLKISPWSKGDTPRPRIKHVAATMYKNSKLIEKVLNDKTSKIESFATKFEQFSDYIMAVFGNYVSRDSFKGKRLSDFYTEVSNEDLLNSRITGLSNRSAGNKVFVETVDGTVEVEFHEGEYAACMAIAVWLAGGFKHALNQVFEVPAIKVDLSPVQKCLYETTFAKLVAEIERDY